MTICKRHLQTPCVKKLSVQITRLPDFCSLNVSFPLVPLFLCCCLFFCFALFFVFLFVLVFSNFGHWMRSTQNIVLWSSILVLSESLLVHRDHSFKTWSDFPSSFTIFKALAHGIWMKWSWKRNEKWQKECTFHDMPIHKPLKKKMKKTTAILQVFADIKKTFPTIYFLFDYLLCIAFAFAFPFVNERNNCFSYKNMKKKGWDDTGLLAFHQLWYNIWNELCSD